MDEKTTGIVSYVTLIGWIVALVTRKEKTEYTSFHIRQMLGLIILQIITGIVITILTMMIPRLYFVWYIIYLLPVVLWIIGFLGAVNNEKKLIPIFGQQFQDWFKSL